MRKENPTDAQRRAVIKARQQVKNLYNDAQEKIQKLQATVQNFPVACCCRCSHWWTPRTGKPKKCPKCKSKLWSTHRTNRQGLRSQAAINATPPRTWAEAIDRLMM